MINQIFFYDLDIISINNFTISIKAIYLLLIFIICFILRKRPNFNLALKIIYLIIVIGIIQLFVYDYNGNQTISLNIFSKLTYYFYNLAIYSFKSFGTYFMVYSNLYLITFIPFYPIFKKHIIFIIFISISQIIILISNYFQVAAQSFDAYHIVIMIMGYLIGYALIKIKIRSQRI